MDHERLDALRPEPARRLAHLVLGEGHDHLALGVHALVDLEAQIARDQRLEAALEPVRRGPRAAAQLEHVAEAARRDEPRPRALALEQRIGRGGRPVHDHLQLGRPRRRAGQRRLHAVGLVGDRRRHLRHAHVAGGLVDEHEIGEGPSHVHPDQLGLRHRSRLERLRRAPASQMGRALERVVRAIRRQDVASRRRAPPSRGSTVARPFPLSPAPLTVPSRAHDRPIIGRRHAGPAACYGDGAWSTILGLILVLILAGPGQAQTYSRCVDAAGKIYLTEGPPPAGIRCVAQATRELKDTLAARPEARSADGGTAGALG